MVAGLAAMEHFGRSEVERLNLLGTRLRTGFEAAFVRAGVRGCATGLGSLANLHLAAHPPRSARDTVDAIAATGSLGRLLHLGLVRRGVFAASRLMFCCSTPMGDADVDAAAAALEDALRELRPLVAARRPELLV